MPLLTPEQVAVSTCHFTYRNFHLIWTIPQTLILYLLARPFLTSLDYSKLVLLPLIALIWTTPWDSELIRSRAWAYPRDCVLFSVWRIPIEEYFFFIIQSIATVLLTTLFTRWISPVKFILRKQTSNSTVWMGASVLAISLGSFMTYASGHNYYMGMILWWSFLPIGFLGYGSSDFIFQIISDGKSLLFLAPLVLTSTYLCFADLFALKRGTWVISAHTSLGIDVVPQLPIEEFTFFWVTNLIIVTACFAFDRCAAVSRVILPDESNPISPLSPINFPFSLRSILIMWRAFLYSPQTRENNHPGEKQSQEELTIHDPMFSDRILKEASKSFYTASLLLPYDLRADLGSAYAFARVTDDLIDLPIVDESFIKSKEKKLYLLSLLKELIDVIYRQSDHRQRFIATLKLFQDQQQEWFREKEVMVKLKYAMRSIIELCDLLPKELVLELLEGYEMDLDLEEAGNLGEIGFRSQEMLITYSERVAGSIGEICIRIVLKRLGLETPSYKRPKVKSQFAPIKPAASDEDLTEFESLIKQARRMGVALQLVNISRDTSSDVLNLKRCYLPSSMFDEEERSSIKSTLRSSSSSQVKASEESSKGLKILRRKAMDLLSIADSEFAASYPALQRLPCSPARTGLRVACSAYAEIGRAVRIQKEEEALEGVKARPTNLRRLWVVIKALYSGW